MIKLKGTYHNGVLNLEKKIITNTPVKVTVVFEEELPASLQISDFSFQETQEILKDYKGSFSDEVVEERRRAL